MHKSLHDNIARFLPKSFKRLLKTIVGSDSGIEPEARLYYSQFGEDACVQQIFAAKAWRKTGRYGDYSDIEEGFFVDVGAHSPVLASNTYWFYERGWRGINVDVLPEAKAAFDRMRPEDMNLQLAVSDEEKEMVFYSWGPKSVYNTLDPDTAAARTEQLGAPDEIRVQTSRLETILDEHLPAGRKVDLLSVDTEGHDLQVLRSNNWEKCRPEVVVVEEHETELEGIITSDVVTFMTGVGYRVYAWTPPSIVFSLVC